MINLTEVQDERVMSQIHNKVGKETTQWNEFVTSNLAKIQSPV